MLLFRKKGTMPDPAQALPGRSEPIPTSERHLVTGELLKGPWSVPTREVLFGLGCFWGAERKFWSLPGVVVTAVGYAAGYTPNPTYDEVCSGMTGHNEVVRLVYDPSRIGLEELLRVFWESHDPTQGMRQGNDVGTQYRSGIYLADPEEEALAARSKAAYAQALAARGYGPVTTEILPMPDFYFAEDYHQQYLIRNPGGYCGLGGTGVACPVGLGVGA
jgi:peptide-methionine (S)-S-oxide reductase